MDFSFTPDQQLLRNAARSFLDEHAKPATVRGLWEDARGESDALWKEMAQLGWLGLSLPEAHGGSGLGMVETAIVLEELGRVACPSPYWPTLLAATAIADAGTDAQQKRWLPAIATGDARASLAFLDAELDWRVDAVATRAERTGAGFTLSGTKRWMPWAHVANVLLVPARIEDMGGLDGPPKPPALGAPRAQERARGAPRSGDTSADIGVLLVDPAASGVTLKTVAAMDPGMRWVDVTLDGVAVGADAVLARPGSGGPLLESVLRRGAVGAAAEMLGAARRCLDMAVGYAKVREQFGQPIGSFQAIRHKCSEMLLEVENSHSAVYYAAWALDARSADHELAASVAKAYVGDSSRKVCGEAIQVHGGIGFTWEYDLHMYFKRAKALEVMYGDADHHRELVLQRISA